MCADCPSPSLPRRCATAVAAWAGLLILAAPRPALAQATATPPAAVQPPVVRLSVAEAISRGVAASHRVGELDARREAAEANVASTRAAERPQLALLGGYTRTNHVDEFGIPQPVGPSQIIYPDVPDNWRSRLDAQWLVYSGGRLPSNTRAAQAEAEAGARDVGAARTDVRLEVARAYWGLVTSLEAVRVVEESLRRLEAYLSDANARFDAGLVPPSDVLSAEAQRALQESSLIAARNAAELANLSLVRLLGLPAETTVEPTEPLERQPGPRPGLPALVDEARRTREDRLALAARIAAGGSRVSAARGAQRPAVAVVAGVDYARPNPRIFPRAEEWNESWDVSVNGSWALFDGGRARADVAAAEANVRALRRRLDEFDSVLELDVRQRQLEIDSSVARATSAATAVRAAAEARRVLQDRYQAGVATATEALDAYVVLLEAELARTRALAGVRLAEAALDRAIGR